MKRFRIQLVWALIVLICGVSLMGMVYLVFNKPEVYINPGIVVTQPSPVAEPAAPLAPRGGSAPQSMFHHTSYSYTYHSPETNSFTGTGKGLYLHSGAEVHSVGGGGNGAWAAAGSSGSGSSRGIVYTQSAGATMPMTRPLPGEQQLVEHPIGDAVLPLLLLAIGYMVYRRKRLAA